MYRFYYACVSWPEPAHMQGGLIDMIEARRKVTRRVFLSHVDREELTKLADHFSYARHPRQGLTMAGDWHIEYFRSVLHGCRVYGFCHSGIEHVFTEDDQ